MQLPTFVFTGSSASDRSSRKDKSHKKSPANSGGSDSETASVISARQPGGGVQNSNLMNIPQDVSGSRQSFRMAMGNPCEFFVDVM